MNFHEIIGKFYVTDTNLNKVSKVTSDISKAKAFAEIQSKREEDGSPEILFVVTLKECDGFYREIVNCIYFDGEEYKKD